MQPLNSKQLKKLHEAYNSVYEVKKSDERQNFERTVINSIGVYMVSEGYSEDDVVEFLCNSSPEDVFELFVHCSNSEVLNSYITEEGFIYGKNLQIEGAIYEKLHLLDEGVRREIKKKIEQGIGWLWDKGTGALGNVVNWATGRGARRQWSQRYGPRRVTGTAGNWQKPTQTPVPGTKRTVATAAVAGGTLGKPLYDAATGALGSTGAQFQWPIKFDKPTSPQNPSSRYKGFTYNEKGEVTGFEK